MLIGYTRPYYEDSDCENQLNLLKTSKCEMIITEEHSSPKKRIQLKNMIKNLQSGDVIIVANLFALADSTRHLVELLEEIDSKGSYLHTLTEQIDTRKKDSYSFLTIAKHLVEFQSRVISEKTKKGLIEAKQKGSIAGRPRKPDENVQRAIDMYQSKNYSLSDIKNETGISKSTLYRYLEH